MARDVDKKKRVLATKRGEDGFVVRNKMVV